MLLFIRRLLATGWRVDASKVVFLIHGPFIDGGTEKEHFICLIVFLHLYFYIIVGLHWGFYFYLGITPD